MLNGAALKETTFIVDFGGGFFVWVLVPQRLQNPIETRMYFN